MYAHSRRLLFLLESRAALEGAREAVRERREVAGLRRLDLQRDSVPSLQVSRAEHGNLDRRESTAEH